MKRCHFWNRKSIASVSRTGGDHLNLPAVCQENAFMFAVNSISCCNHEWWGSRSRASIPVSLSSEDSLLPCAMSRSTLLIFSVTQTHSPSHHTLFSSKKGWAGWLTRTAVLLGLWCDTAAQRDADPEPSWYDAQHRPNKGLLPPRSSMLQQWDGQAPQCEAGGFIASHLLSLLLAS